MQNEQSMLFGRDRNLVGIVTEPGTAVSRNGLGAIFLNAGVVHRVGPNRIYVNIARDLARQGFVAARFDLAGIGDSPARRDAAPFEQAAVDDTRDVMSRLESTYGIRQFILLGLCSGAVVSFKAAIADDRVAGAVLINPQGFGGSPEWMTYVVDRGRTQQYVRKMLRLSSWRRLLTGHSDYRLAWGVLARRMKGLRRPDAAVSEFSRGVAGDFERLTARGVRLLLACSGGDYSLDYLDVIMGPHFRRFGRGALQVQVLPAGDHSLTMWESQRMFQEAVNAWVSSLAGAARADWATSRSDAASDRRVPVQGRAEAMIGSSE